MLEEAIYRPGYNPEFLRKVRAKQKQAEAEAEALKAKELIRRNNEKKLAGFNVDAANVLAEIAAKHGVPIEVIWGNSRTQVASAERHEACYELRRRLPWLSWPRIASYIGGRDHTTAIHGAAIHAARNGLPPVTSTVIIAKRARYHRAAQKARRAE